VFNLTFTLLVQVHQLESQSNVYHFTAADFQRYGRF